MIAYANAAGAIVEARGPDLSGGSSALNRRSNEAKNSKMLPFVAVKDARIADFGSRGL